MTGNDMVQRWMRHIQQYVHVSDQQALILALWAMHTWMYQQFHATPYLEIFATTKRSGKSTLLSVLGNLCQNTKQFATVRVLTVVRMIEAFEGKITCMFDEAERLAAASLGDTRSMLAMGYRKGGVHAVSVGKDFQEFPVYCPKAFALIGNLTGVLRDRSIPIQLQRSVPAVDFHANVMSAEEQAGELVQEFVNVVKGLKLDRVPVISPEYLQGRDREIFTPLLSVAHLLGLSPSVMETFKAAAVDLCVMKTWEPKKYHSAQDETDAEDRDAASRALADLVSIVREGETVIPSGVAIERLRGLSGAPWRMWRETGINEIILAALLARYGLGTENVQVGKGRKERKIVKGYKVAAIMAAASENK